MTDWASFLNKDIRDCLYHNGHGERYDVANPAFHKDWDGTRYYMGARLMTAIEYEELVAQARFRWLAVEVKNAFKRLAK